MISHGLCSACMFFLLDVFFKYLGSRRFFLLRGSSIFLPILSIFWFILCIANMGFPPSFNFFSEVFIVAGVLRYSFIGIFLLFFLGLVRGLYRVFLFSFLRHGKTSSWGLSFSFIKTT